MARAWEERWESIGAGTQGGQGVGRVVRRRDAPNDEAFLKTLNRPSEMKARKRFYREISAYRTIDHPSVPALLDDNAASWADKNVELFAVTDLVRGPTLDVYVAKNSVTFDDAVRMARRIADVLVTCHGEQIVHRDLKPRNVILRDGAVDDPVVVDFGLSFNAADDEFGDGVTRVGEEVGNRFLRLPEHAIGGRLPVSDVTQAVGLMFFALTGDEPRVLTDSEGLPPHQRRSARTQLNDKVGGPTGRRLLSLFDRAFDPRVTLRIQTATDLDVELMTLSTPHSAGGSDEVDQMFDEIARDSKRIEVRDQLARVESFAKRAIGVVDQLARANNMESVQGGFQRGIDPVPWARTTLAIRHGPKLDSRMRGGAEYRFEARGSEVVFIGNAVELWRGSDVKDEALAARITRFAKENLVREVSKPIED